MSKTLLPSGQSLRSYPGWTGKICVYCKEHVYPIGDRGWCQTCGEPVRHQPAHAAEPDLTACRDTGELSSCSG